MKFKWHLPNDLQKINYPVMQKETFYKVTIAVLIVLNLLQVGARFMAHRLPGDPIKMPVRHLGLDDLQEKQFRDLAKAHRQKMTDFRTQQSFLTEAYFDHPSDTLLTQVTSIEGKKIEETGQHFIAIKNLLQESQYDEFEDFKKRSIKRILGFPPPYKPGVDNP